MTNGNPPKKSTWVGRKPGAHTNKKALSALNTRIDRANDKIRSLRARVVALENLLVDREDDEDE